MSEVDRCVRALRQGEVVAAPTDTFFGLLADPFSDGALSTLCRLKNASDARPWPLLLPRGFDVGRIGCTLSRAGRSLAGRFWPGKVTLIVACDGALASRVGRASDGAVGLRIPGGPDLLVELLGAFDGPLTGTSANPAGCEPAVRSLQVEAYFPGELGGVLPGTAPGGAPSTVVDTVSDPVRIVRAGEVSTEAIQKELLP